MDDDFDELDQLLMLVTTETELAPERGIVSTDETTVASCSTENQTKPKKTNDDSKTADNGMDSSDEEDLQNFLERKYNEYGRDVNTMLKQKVAERQDSFIDREVRNSLSQNLRQNTKTERNQRTQLPPVRPAATSVYQPKPIENINIYTDPIFGLRIVQPLVSSSLLSERMAGRTPIDMKNLNHHIDHADLSQDWCLGGVIVSKSPVQTSQKGGQYLIWRVSDLKGDIKTVSLFLFKSAYKDLWKTSQGTAIAVLNPHLFPRKDGKNSDITLSIDTAQKVMILGRSKDLGTCKSKKKNGEPCTSIVNTRVCEFCVYHVKQEYSKMSGRSELQSATSGRGLQALRNKVLGKSEVFYGGQSFVAESTKKNKKLVAKDQKRLMTLSDHFQSTPMAAAISNRPSAIANFGTKRAVSRIAEGFDIDLVQRKKDLERLSLLKGPQNSSKTSSDDTEKSLKPSTVPPAKSPLVSTTNCTNTTDNSIAFSNRLMSSLANTPKLSGDFSQSLTKAPKLSKDNFSFTIDRNSAAKAKAMEILKKKPLDKPNPNLIKYRGTVDGKKRLRESIGIEDDENTQAKKKREAEVEAFRNERIKTILEATSSHKDLIKARENQEQEKYFTKLEKKEMMEEKMVNTLKMDCKAVVCPVCKYKAFTAAEICKTERHPFKVIDAEKRFFECEDCKNRVTSLFRIPKTSCSNCQSSRWKRTGMMRERKLTNFGEQLSIRGDEETFLGSVQNTGNLNLCVATE